MYHCAMVYSRSEFMMIANKTDTPVRVQLFDRYKLKTYHEIVISLSLLGTSQSSTALYAFLWALTECFCTATSS